MNILIIGGSRFVGVHVVALLLKHKHSITVFNRGLVSSEYPSEVRFIKGDRHDSFGIKDHFDAVIDMCAYEGKDTEFALQQLEFDYFLQFSSVAVYKRTNVFPISEEAALGGWTSSEYDQGKYSCEQVLAADRRAHGIIRPVYILGQKNYCDRERFIYSHIINQIPLILPGDGRGMTQFVFADEVARSIVALVEGKISGAFNISGNEIMTLTGLVEMMGDIVGEKPIITFNPDAIGTNYKEEEFPFDNDTLIVSNEKIKQSGIEFIPLQDGLRSDFENWYKYNL
jgi:nucleoside-diphosphate-sugar epimerase